MKKRLIDDYVVIMMIILSIYNIILENLKIDDIICITYNERCENMQQEYKKNHNCNRAGDKNGFK
ncbi:MAG: hypothetical protein HFI16_14670 [Lachnospiraceae bacterium]|nr:hypothetical protein [Lachnospiraceae bacterium]